MRRLTGIMVEFIIGLIFVVFVLWGTGACDQDSRMVIDDKNSHTVIDYQNPHLVIDYRLECSDVFLKYVTPQITYKGNDGVPVTFSISESDWAVTYVSNSKMATIVVDEDTIVFRGHEKIMRWTKHVEYDDFVVVDDEMRVVYVPKGNMPMGNSFPTLIKPVLTKSIELMDNDESKWSSSFETNNLDVIQINENQLFSDVLNRLYDREWCHVERNGFCIY